MKQNDFFGAWRRDEADLPCFDGRFWETDLKSRSFVHCLGTGRVNAFTDQWGLLRIATTEAGYVDLSKSWGQMRSGLYFLFHSQGESHSLIFDDFEVKTGIRYGMGYAIYEGERRTAGLHLAVRQEFLFPRNRLAGAHSRLILRNLSKEAVSGELRIAADIDPHMELKQKIRPLVHGSGRVFWPDFYPGLGDCMLFGPEDFHGVTEAGVTLQLSKPLTLKAGETVEVPAWIGYGCSKDAESLLDECLGVTLDAVGKDWKERLSPVRFDLPEDWMQEEILWSAAQLHSFEAYDSSANEFYINLGGYGWQCFGVREACETMLPLSLWDRPLAESSMRWVAKFQRSNGDIPQCHDFRRPEDWKTAPQPGHKESDNEIWFLLACGELADMWQSAAFLEEQCPFWEGEDASLWEHARRAFHWVREGVGLGAHGLIHIGEGDWNDYLSSIGAGGKGESVMNSGMACRALDRLIPWARKPMPEFAREMEEFVTALRAAVERTFDGQWFVRGYTDAGRPVGTSEEDRLFINAQSWCVLARAGTASMRRQALQAVLEKCHSPIGLTLVSRPFSCPPPHDISLWAIPRGEGENGGIWPQTVHWMIWALAEEGMVDEAREVWKRISLRNHASCHPQVPFGIFNGPDCYSSHHSASREGWTQVQLLDRAGFLPMNPMIAWQPFSMKKILDAK